MPDRPSDRQMAPWEAVLAQAMQREDPEGTALEAMQAAQDFATHTGHLLELSEAFWRLDVVPKIDEMVRQRVTPGRVRPVHEGPGAARVPPGAAGARDRRHGPSLTCSTRSPPSRLTGSAASPRDFTDGREKNRPRRGARQPDGLSARPGRVTPEIEAAGQMLDARQAALGERLAANPPAWAKAAWGTPPAEAGALRA